MVYDVRVCVCVEGKQFYCREIEISFFCFSISSLKRENAKIGFKILHFNFFFVLNERFNFFFPVTHYNSALTATGPYGEIFPSRRISVHFSSGFCASAEWELNPDRNDIVFDPSPHARLPKKIKKNFLGFFFLVCLYFSNNDAKNIFTFPIIFRNEIIV